MSLKEIPIHSYYNQTRRCYQKTPESLPSSSKDLIPMVSLKDVEALIRETLKEIPIKDNTELVNIGYNTAIKQVKKSLLGKDDVRVK